VEFYDSTISITEPEAPDGMISKCSCVVETNTESPDYLEFLRRSVFKFEDRVFKILKIEEEPQEQIEDNWYVKFRGKEILANPVKALIYAEEV
jgi:hypothetical protein